MKDVYRCYNRKNKQSVLKLKDAFRTEDGKLIDAESDIQVRVRMININYGKNKELMAACKPLSDYAWFIAEIRRCNETMGIEAAVDSALDNMSEDSVLKKFLEANKAEVRQMCITEYNEAETMEQFKEEGREEGREEGIILHLINVVYKKMLKGRTSAEIAEEIEEDAAMIDQIERAVIAYKKGHTDEEFNAAMVLGYYKRQVGEGN